ncbi:hypothetical protein RchiOBHm_Chr4g0442281 [Rosa chinensis]|uniref:Uncharacterized protein n=1 Tax=Rosa chinensis TaxID=74649 RepID=A0A2P6R3H9_ROSCH|nr:hypothetical protein RchiOBHm_Chr4g0442281 [Rosa chinensis]
MAKNISIFGNLPNRVTLLSLSPRLFLPSRPNSFPFDFFLFRPTPDVIRPPPSSVSSPGHVCGGIFGRFGRKSSD